jgi:putative FmdB family regulatory protein
MPIYEYRRPDGTTFEIVQSFSDPPLECDPDTGAPVERVLHAPAVHFKGSGFYNTDYGTRKRQRETAATEGESSASKDTSTDGSSTGSDRAKGGEVKTGGDRKQAGEKASTNGAKPATANAVKAKS